MPVLGSPTSTDSPSTFILSSNRAFEFMYMFLCYHLCSLCLVMGSVLLIFLVLCVVFVFFFFLVPNVARVVVLYARSWLSGPRTDVPTEPLSHRPWSSVTDDDS
jgi:hypothetical protein